MRREIYHELSQNKRQFKYSLCERYRRINISLRFDYNCNSLADFEGINRRELHYYYVGHIIFIIIIYYYYN